MNQVIIAYHAVCSGEVKLSPELVDYKLYFAKQTGNDLMDQQTVGTDYIHVIKRR